MENASDPEEASKAKKKCLEWVARVSKFSFGFGVLSCGLFTLSWRLMDKSAVIPMRSDTCDYFCPFFGVFAAVVFLCTLCVQRRNTLRHDRACTFPLLIFALISVVLVLGFQVVLLGTIKSTGYLYFALQSPPYSFRRLWDALTASNKRAISAALKCSLPATDDCPEDPLPVTDCCGAYYEALVTNDHSLVASLAVGFLLPLFALAISATGTITLWMNREPPKVTPKRVSQDGGEHVSLPIRSVDGPQVAAPNPVAEVVVEKQPVSVPSGQETPAHEEKKEEFTDKNKRELKRLHLLEETDRIEQELCGTFHRRAKDAATYEALKVLAAQGTENVRELFKVEMELVAELTRDLSGGTKQAFSNFKKNKITQQPVKEEYLSPEGFIKVANVAQAIFTNCLEDVRDNAGLFKLHLEVGPVKSLKRLKEKMQQMEANGENPLAVYDLNRATLLAKTAKNVMDIYVGLIKHFSLLRLKHKFDADKLENLITEPPCLFFQMGLQTEELEPFLLDGKPWVVELQITTPGIYKVKAFSHKFYEITRSEVMPSECVVCNGK